MREAATTQVADFQIDGLNLTAPIRGSSEESFEAPPPGHPSVERPFVAASSRPRGTAKLSDASTRTLKTESPR